jgi:cell fate regulator YaaT (PSP1 superfamily)
MAEIVGIRFKRAGRVYYFDPAGITLAVNDCVVARTNRGLELGRVVIAPSQVVANEITEPLQPVVRKATPDDIKKAEEFAAKEDEALAECGKLIEKLNLSMKLLSAEYNLDGSRITFYFSAEERVDFRELVRELAARFKVKVDLRQVGPRDETKLVGGFGRCGRPLCCMSFLSEFAPVSIKMAKEQNLPLNPMKISGVCGRLLCCLTYENELYRDMKEKLPRVGAKVSTPMGIANVVGTNPLKESVMVELESEAVVEMPLSDITLLEDASSRKPGKAGNKDREEKSETDANAN